MESNDQHDNYMDRPGYVIRGARNIAAYMQVSPATIARWRKRFRGRTELLLCFPAFSIPTGRGWRWQMITHTSLILDWMQRWCEIDGQMLQEKARWRRTRKVQRVGETVERPQSDESTPELREGAPRRPRQKPTGCTCGTPTPCTAH